MRHVAAASQPRDWVILTSARSKWRGAAMASRSMPPGAFLMSCPRSIFCLVVLSLVFGGPEGVQSDPAMDVGPMDARQQSFPAPDGQKPGVNPGPGMGQGDDSRTPAAGPGSPVDRAARGHADPSAGKLPGSAAPGLSSPQGWSEGWEDRRVPRGLGVPAAAEDLPVFGPPPGLGRGSARDRPRGGPGYPGLRGPGTGYPKHRQYGEPPGQGTRAPGNQN